MSRKKTAFGCTECGATFAKWTGQCPHCQEWNSVQEIAQPASGSFQGYSGQLQSVQAMADIKPGAIQRFSSTFAELDRVLGGGIVPGSVILLGGDPGVGKSTALLQVSCQLSRQYKVLYVSGEESLEQIAMRARRLKLPDQNLLLLAETRLEQIVTLAAQQEPQLLIIDSIQTMQLAETGSAPGSVSQVRDCAARLTAFAKQSGTAIFLVGHVTKSGDLAGPRVLEHIIDVVCYVEGNRDSRFRIVRAVKNRFGAVNEIGVFAMTEQGMRQISNPSAIFLSRHQQEMAGSVIMVIWEGSRPLLVEIQALADEATGEHARRVTVGLEGNRLAMLLAVLHRHGHVATYGYDVFINIVGGVKVAETSVDLALVLALVSSLQDQPLPPDLVVFGEIGLAGEIRPVPSGLERLREAAKHGFHHAILPQDNLPGKAISGIECHGVKSLAEALRVAQSLGGC